MTGKSYLDMAEAEAAAGADTTSTPAQDLDLDLSGLSPTPVQRPDRLREAVDEGRRRGFGRGAESSTAPAARRATTGKAAKPAPAPKRVIVTLAERPPAGANGQVALTGDAEVIYEFIRRAHYERRPRGELLADMLKLYAEKRGPVPEEF